MSAAPPFARGSGPSGRWTRSDRLERRVVEDDVGRDFVFARAPQAPGAQRVEALRRLRRQRAHAQLLEETARRPDPRDREPALRARHADVEEPPFLLEL